jgi:hypothetical protein
MYELSLIFPSRHFIITFFNMTKFKMTSVPRRNRAWLSYFFITFQPNIGAPRCGERSKFRVFPGRRPLLSRTDSIRFAAAAAALALVLLVKTFHSRLMV